MAMVLMRVDDLTEERADETVFFELDSDAYEIDLTAANAAWHRDTHRAVPLAHQHRSHRQPVRRHTLQRPPTHTERQDHHQYRTRSTVRPARTLHGEAMTETPSSSAAELDTSRPHTARMYDYYLGGKDNFPPDAEAAEKVRELFPAIGTVALENRRFMHRATRTLASEYGVRQFVDIGTGIPTEPNLHQVAQRVAPEARVVYADHDPLVLDHADALMHSTIEGRTRFVLGDLRHDAILDHPELREVIDLDKPVALSLVALLHFVPDAARPHQLVHDLVSRLCSGSFLVLSHVTHDPRVVGEQAAQAWRAVQEVYRRGGTPAQARTEADIREFFDGMELIEPGLTLTHQWRPGPEQRGITPAESSMLAAVAHKP